MKRFSILFLVAVGLLLPIAGGSSFIEGQAVSAQRIADRRRPLRQPSKADIAAPAATIEVDTYVDSITPLLNACVTGVPGDCSLRGAVSVANDGDTIIFVAPASPTIALLDQIFVGASITIAGPGADQLTLNASSISRVFFISGETVTISGLSLTGGNVGSGGGAIFALSGAVLTLDGLHVFGNNAAGAPGGGILSTGSTLTLRNSTISQNQADTGGGISCDDATIVNSTISGNTATSSGGGVFKEDGLTSIRNSTITNNSAPVNAGLSSGLDNTTLGSTIIAGNTSGSGPEFGTHLSSLPSAITSEGFNLLGAAAGGSPNSGGVLTVTYQTSDIRDTNPQLAPLTNNGGPTPTHALLSTPSINPAHDKGSVFGALLATDQRGFVRTVEYPGIPNALGGDATDIGAFEIQAPSAAPAFVAGRVLTSDGVGIRNVFVTIQGVDGHPQTVRTGTSGRYRFDGLTVGETYLVTVRSQRYAFSPSSQFFSLNDNITDLNFTTSP